MFARGSGQDLFANENRVFREQMESRFEKGGDSFGYYQVGSEKVDGHQYPAVPVNGSLDAVKNAAGAKFSSGQGNDYGKSVDQGVDELGSILKKRMESCPSTVFILGGYSQGAQVIGETYIEKLDATQRSRVVFNALFGDPKLYLPEGESHWHKAGGELFPSYYAKACRGADLSEWRREVPNCNTDNGSLGARKPYLPASFTSTTGLWCANQDFVCGSSKNLFNNGGHGTYWADKGDIHDAVLEAARRVASARPDLASQVNTTEVKPISGSTGLDVVFVVDSTGSMSSYINSAKAFARDMAGRIGKQNGRVALVEYRDLGDTFTARVLAGLNADTTAIQEKLDAITVGGGGDTPEAALHALMTAFNGLEWRKGATKAAILLTDADYHDPDKVDGSTLAAVAKRSLEIDPVNVYPVVPAYFDDFYKSLAESTTGQVVINNGDAAAALEATLTKIESRPVPVLPFMDYYAPVGEVVTFDASKSYSVGSEIVRWDWDFDGDGTYEVLNGTSSASHAYTSTFEGTMQARATDAKGLVANISATVHIGTVTGTEGQPAPADTLTATGEGTSATLLWTGLETPSYAWAVTVNGIEVGLVEPGVRTATLSDLDRSITTEVGVVPVTTEGLRGQARVAYIEPEPVASPSATATATPSDTTSPTASGSPSTPSVTDQPTPSSTSSIVPAGAIRDQEPPAATATSPLPVTGAQVIPLLFAAGAALTLGAGIVILLRQRHRQSRKH